MLKRLVLAALLCAGPACAALQARDLDANQVGFEAAYDDARNITWLADAQANGAASWWDQTAFAASLVVGATDGWRLASFAELSGFFYEWRNASIQEFGWDAFLAGASSNVGFGSTLFTNNLLRDYWAGDFGTELNATIFFPDRPAPDAGFGPKTAHAYAWVVHQGDVGTPPIPEPEISALLLVGLSLLIARRH